MNATKRHHYLPRMLLRNLTTPNEDTGRLFAFDREERRRFITCPSNAGVIRDFNTIEASVNIDPNAIEKYFAQIEGLAAPALREAIEFGRITSRWNRDALIMLAALQIQRSPRARNQLEGAWLSQIIANAGEYARNVASRRRWRDRAIKHGLPESCYTPEGFVAFLTSGEFTVRSDHESWKSCILVKTALPMLVRSLQPRHWSIAATGLANEPLILADVGVIPRIWNGQIASAGWASPEIDVVLPLNSKIFLCGSYEPSRWNRLSPEEATAELNMFSLAYADRFVYCSESDFIYSTVPGRGTRWSDAITLNSAFPRLIDSTLTRRLMTAR